MATQAALLQALQAGPDNNYSEVIDATFDLDGGVYMLLHQMEDVAGQDGHLTGDIVQVYFDPKEMLRLTPTVEGTENDDLVIVNDMDIDFTVEGASPGSRKTFTNRLGLAEPNFPSP